MVDYEQYFTLDQRMKHFHLGYQVLIAVIMGSLVGMFLGPLVSIFKPISTIYAILLQMVVLPYICFSLIHGLGLLTPSRAKELLKKSWFFWILLWGLVFLIIYLIATLIPEPVASPMLQPQKSVSIDASLIKNILTYLIPENPTYDFVHNIVPSIAIFGIIVGVTLMHMEKKEPLIGAVERTNQVIEKILEGLAIISPIGVFAHVAEGVGRIQISEWVQINLYLIGFITITLFLTLWALPVIISSLTPLTFRESLKEFQSVCLLPFVTGIPTIAIPFIGMSVQRLGKKYSFHSDPNFRNTTQTLIPISYSFVQIGNCLLLFFILFASFYLRHPFTGVEKSLLSFLTIPLSIGSSGTSINAVTFLFKELHFSDDALILFTGTMPLTINFQILLSVAGILTFIILVLFASFHLIHVQWRKMFLKLFIPIFGAVGILGIVSHYIHFKDQYRDFYINQNMNDAITASEFSTPVFLTMKEANDHLRNPDQDILEQILRTGILRVGYSVGNMPYAYMNLSDRLVGFDIAMAYQLAKDLNCQLEFVPVDISHIDQHLEQGFYDIAMGAILMNEERISQMSFSDAYTDQNYALIIPEKNRSRFSNLDDLNQTGIIIGAVGAYQKMVTTNFPQATLYAGTDEKGYEMDKVDAWMSIRIPAAIWCFSHPQYTLNDFDGRLGKCYLAYPVKRNAIKFLQFINNWMQLKILDGFYQKQNDYWILGKPIAPAQERRWSIIHNVLHWTQ